MNVENSLESSSTTYWISDTHDRWEIEVLEGADVEAAILADLKCYDAPPVDHESQHICVDYGTYDEGGDPYWEGSLTKTAHPAAWNDGEGWEETGVVGSGGGVCISYRRGRTMRASCDTWHQHSHNGQVCENDHIRVWEEEPDNT